MGKWTNFISGLRGYEGSGGKRGKAVILGMVGVIIFAVLGYYVGRYQRLSPLKAVIQPLMKMAEEPVPPKYESGEVPQPTAEKRTTEPIGGVGRWVPDFAEKVIKSAMMNIKVNKGDYQKTYDRAVFICESVGGYITSSNSSATEGSLTSGTLTIRVPVKAFEKVLAQLRKLGKVQSVTISGEDVTEEYVDLESRLKNLRAQEAILLKLMEKATSIQDTIAVESRLADIQMQIEQILGRKNYLDNRVTFATVQLTLFEPSAEPIVGCGFREALEKAARAFVASVNGMILFLGAVGPYLILTGMWIVIYLQLRRRKAPSVR